MEAAGRDTPTLLNKFSVGRKHDEAKTHKLIYGGMTRVQTAAHTKKPISYARSTP